MDIAVIGGGVSGLVAAYLLRRTHHVELFEERATAGGHANTVVVRDERGAELPLDVGFIVYNERTYHVFARLLRELGVETQASDMSFGVRSEEDDFEYSSRGWRGYLGRPRNLLNLRRALMGLDVLRFQRDARAVLRRDTLHDVPFEEYLRRGRYTRDFRERIIVPLIASTWSNAPADVLAFPTNYLFRFLEQHGVLALHSIPEWRWVVGGARRYVEAILRHLAPGDVHLGTTVSRVSRDGDGACVVADGQERRFDAVVLACHADQALKLLADPTEEERTALGGFRYAANHVVLHTDERVLPRRPWMRAAWNYHRIERDGFPRTLTMSYDLTRLQRLPGDVTYCVSVNPGDRVASERVLASFQYAHPVYSLATLEAQRRVEALQGQRATYFAGAHLGYGFHEDGARSGLAVAERLGVRW
ncbi:MAG: NAD(P)/FAD-dependent oxidoreductase [Dehalococcoidia bacterium]